MEIVEAEADGGDSDLTEVAFVDNPQEGGAIQGLLESAGIVSILEPTTIDGPMLGYGLLPPKYQRLMVRPDQADEARRVLSEALVAEPEELIAEPSNAAYLEDARGRRPRSYGVLGGYARIWAFGLLSMAVIFGVFVLLRAT